MAFIHYSDSNIHEKTILEALRVHYSCNIENQPFNQNHLRPCPLLDNPDALVRMVEKSGAKSTHLKEPEDVREVSAKCQEAAKKWAPVADELREKSMKAKEEALVKN